MKAAHKRTPAVVINPSKVDDVGAAEDLVASIARRNGWNEPLWFETSPDDSGVGAARAALEAGAELVCSMGGDGTVSAVATVLRGTSVPYGLLPSGTGNLLARNLGIPLGSLPEAVEIALLGQDRAIDVGTATFDDGEERVFMVMGGVGLDAEIMDKTDAELKKRVGWGAYFAAGAPAMFKAGFDVTLTIDGAREPTQRCYMVLACNCSSVVANIELAAGAVLDDGDLELVLLRRRFGLALDVATGNRNGLASLRQWPGREFSFELGQPVLAELDGDPIGRTRSGRFGVDPGALLVRLPVPTPRSPGLTPRDSMIVDTSAITTLLPPESAS
ncbi:diacylglycerol kinase [Rathayibacter rathayi]|uniref:diacylglycerol/lipid kinase family protein n=1 Tax=Rathayibacter rathayi TaxID=33887 RepID=UPI000CE8B334|nr:diacylglycerol kinase family protein [Rathayibacter rathayi]PPF21445.1 diacylglycerol kinase [Rathayibacter rathayi]PPG67438.1 diacylglycerol kinase [Rathayibacter rathayi]PPG75852.1 diacylglycerol kinase [Rathayibacter rathayi]PPG83572.1 diacylglycerol kinase [Rathayibacter rathayi]PPG88803.1 diacylglycerol kinase [Rathayibacter rathayi]